MKNFYWNHLVFQEYQNYHLHFLTEDNFSFPFLIFLVNCIERCKIKHYV